jgi:dUTP pyrophosphatase
MDATKVDTVALPVITLPHALPTLPAYATSGSAGADVLAAVENAVTLAPMQRALIPTGLILLIPQGYEVQIRARSGLAIKHGITLINAIGTIDSDYRHELKVALVNLGDQPYTIERGDRIAQLVVAPVVQASFTVAELTPAQAQAEFERQGGFGSTGR